MIVKKGKQGLNLSHQNAFLATTICDCGGEGRIALVCYEGENEEFYLCGLYKNQPHAMWPHDAIAIAIYFCKECMKPITLCNEA